MRGYTIATFIIALLAVTLAIAAPHPKKKGRTIAIPLIKRNSSTLLHPDNTVNFAAVDAHAASVSAYVVKRSPSAGLIRFTSKIIRGLNNYEQNTGTTHPSVLERRPQKRDGGLPLTKYRNLIWECTISIGSPPKEFVVEIDTGSTDLFVLSADAATITSENRVWNPSSSSTVIDLNVPFEIMFGNGDMAIGKQYIDNVTIAGFTADKQTIGSATTFVFMGKHGTPVDGILGLAFGSISDFPSSSLFETLISENKLTDPVFSVQLTSSGGELFVGGTNEALYQKDTLVYADVTKQGYWEIKVDEIQANGQTIVNDDDFVIDTGSNFISGDNAKVSQLNVALGGQLIVPGRYSIPCHADPEPSVIFTLGGRPFKLPVEMLRLGPIRQGSSQCFSTIISNGASAPFWIAGSQFLQTVYTVFDRGTGPQARPRVGFAELAQSSG